MIEQSRNQTHRSNIEQMQHQFLILSKHLAISDDIKKRVGDLTSGSGNDNANRFRLKTRNKLIKNFPNHKLLMKV